MIRCRDLWFVYPEGEQALRGINFTFDRRSLALIGPNASGKTTLLKILSILLRPTRGEVRIDGVDPWALSEYERVELRRRVVYVHEKPVLFRGSVLYNLTYPLRLRGFEKARAVERGMEILSLLDVEDLAHVGANALSMGQARLISLARALVVEPAYLLLDEPTAYLDRENARLILSVLEDFKSRGIKLVLATHTREASEIAEVALILHRGELIVKCSPEDLRAEMWSGPP